MCLPYIILFIHSIHFYTTLTPYVYNETGLANRQGAHSGFDPLPFELALDSTVWGLLPTVVGLATE